MLDENMVIKCISKKMLGKYLEERIFEV